MQFCIVSISIIQEPTGILPVKNNQKFVFATDNMITTAGVAAFFNKPLSTIPNDGETYILSWGTNSVTFTFKNTPVDFTDVQIEATTTDTVTALVNVAKNQFQLFNDFYIAQVTTNFRLQARQTGTAYDITATGTGAYNFLAGFITAGVDEVVRDDFRFYIDLFVENSFGSGSYDLVLATSVPPDTSQEASFDPYLQMRGELDYDLPQYNAVAPQLLPNVIKLFQIKITEFYDDSTHNYETIWNNYGILAALKEKDIPITDFTDVYCTAQLDRKFLTTIPRDNILVTQEQQYFLGYYQNPAYSIAYVVLNIVYSDNSNTLLDKHFTLSQPGQVISIPVGYTALDIENLKTAGKTVSYYQIYVWQNGTDYQDATDFTEVFTLNLNTNYYPNNKYLLFNNSLGVLDSVCFTGENETLIESNDNTFRNYKLDNSTTLIKAEIKQQDTDLIDATIVNTGILEKEQAEYLRELLCATEVYEDKDGQFVAIYIKRESVKELYKSDDFVYGLQFEYTEAQFNKA